MNFLYNKELNENHNITKTGYRALFLLIQLIQQPLSRNELIGLLEENPILNKDFSKDTITNTINTLRKAGCIISRPSQKTQNKYVLKSHPFIIYLSPQHIKALQTFREGLIASGNWRLVFLLNNLYTKIAKLTKEECVAKTLKNNHPFKDIDIDIINNLILFIKTGKKARFIYTSPSSGAEELEFSPEYITFENQKLYVWGHNLKYDNFGYLRIDKIKEIATPIYKAQNAAEDHFEKPVLKVEYILKGNSLQTFVCNEYEEIIEKSECTIKVAANVSNKFNFYQRILSFGTDCKILTPKSAQKELLNILNKIKTGYKNAGQ